MLEKPDLSEARIRACLQDDYGLRPSQVAFLPLGADSYTAVYRVVAADETPYFLKLRSGNFAEISLALPKFLSDQGLAQIISPLTTKSGQLWASLDPFKVILYPFVAGRNGYEVDLAARHWVEFGATLKRIHGTVLPLALANRMPPERYSPWARQTVKTLLAGIETEVYPDPVAGQLTTFLRLKRAEILDLVERAERLAEALQAQPREFVVCHSDLHAGNVLIEADDAFYIVDWDEPILAPKERDLMFVGGGQGFSDHSALEEERLFYQGYGHTQVDATALAYYRYERIIQDIAVYCQELLLTTEGGADREQSLIYLKSNFLAKGTIAMAYRADPSRREG